MGGYRDEATKNEWIHFEDVVTYIRWVRFCSSEGDYIHGMPQSDISVDGIEKLREASQVADRWEQEDAGEKLAAHREEQREKDAEIERRLDAVRARGKPGNA